MTLNEPIIIVFTHVPDMQTAEQIAQGLLADKLAACVNISSPVRSLYRWQGAIEATEEIALSIKTRQSAYAACAEKLRAMHPYELPEIVGIHVDTVLPEYQAWIYSETSGQE